VLLTHRPHRPHHPHPPELHHLPRPHRRHHRIRALGLQPKDGPVSLLQTDGVLYVAVLKLSKAGVLRKPVRVQIIEVWSTNGIVDAELGL
jgi:hypothetical protein